VVSEDRAAEVTDIYKTALVEKCLHSAQPMYSNTAKDNTCHINFRGVEMREKL
jgi:hypothetical protein